MSRVVAQARAHAHKDDGIYGNLDLIGSLLWSSHDLYEAEESYVEEPEVANDRDC